MENLLFNCFMIITQTVIIVYVININKNIEPIFFKKNNINNVPIFNYK